MPYLLVRDLSTTQVGKFAFSIVTFAGQSACDLLSMACGPYFR